MRQDAPSAAETASKCSFLSLLFCSKTGSPVFVKENARMKGGNKENMQVFINRNSVLNLLPFCMKGSWLQNFIKSICVCCASIPVAL